MKLTTLGACIATLSAALACSSAPEDSSNAQETLDDQMPAQRMNPGASNNQAVPDIAWETVAVTTTQHRYSPVDEHQPTVLVDVPVYRASKERIAREVTHRAVFSANSPQIEAARAQEDENQ